jgi:cytochrome bd-type quinol oxidase subunit 1
VGAAHAGIRILDDLGSVLAPRRQHVRGQPTIEGLAAFFLESTFLGPWLFGWDKLPKRVHLLTIWAVSLGGAMSAAFIHGGQLWMQHPAGCTMVNGKPVLNDIWAVFTNPVSVWGTPRSCSCR